VSSDSGIVTAWQPSFSLVRGPFSCLRHYIAQNPIGESRLRACRIRLPRRTRRRLARYRTGCEGRISHLKRGYGLRRNRLRGDQGQRIWTGWAVLAYNLDTLAIQAA